MTLPHPPNNNEAVTEKKLKFRYDLENAPRGMKVIVLTKANIAIMGVITGNPSRDSDLKGWHPLMTRDLDEEKARGYLD